MSLSLPLTEEGARKETKADGRTKDRGGKMEPGGRDGIRDKRCTCEERGRRKIESRRRGSRHEGTGGENEGVKAPSSHLTP